MLFRKAGDKFVYWGPVLAAHGPDFWVERIDGFVSIIATHREGGIRVRSSDRIEVAIVCPD